MTPQAMHVLEPGFLTTVQDLGRPLGEPLGAPAGGAMDRLALMAANALVGNPVGAAALEFALSGPALQVGYSPECGVLVAAAGRGFKLEVGGRSIPLWMAAWARCGETITLHGEGGGWGYLAISGGIDVPEVLGSRSTCLSRGSERGLRAGFGGLEGRALQPGDSLPIGPSTGDYDLAGREVPDDLRPAYSDHPLLDVVLGPQQDAFTPGAVESLLNEEYTLTPACDRMGYRLSGPALVRHSQGPAQGSGTSEMLSEGVAFGAVQVPQDGQPIVLMADRQTTGGYPKIAVVSGASLPLLAQCSFDAGTGSVRFKAVSVAEAQEKWRRMRWMINSIG